MGRLRAHIGRVVVAAFALALPTMSIAASALPARATPALWRVHNGTSTVYLFGSLHILPRGYGWTTPEIERAMSASDLFIFEVPVDEAHCRTRRHSLSSTGFCRPTNPCGACSPPVNSRPIRGFYGKPD